MKAKIIVLSMFLVLFWWTVEKTSIATPLAGSQKKEQTNARSLPQLIEKVKISLKDLEEKIKEGKAAGLDTSEFQGKLKQLRKDFDSPINQPGLNPIELYKRILTKSTVFIKAIDMNIGTKKKDNKKPGTAKPGGKSSKNYVNKNAGDKTKIPAKEADDKKPARTNDKISLVLKELETIKANLKKLEERIERASTDNRSTKSKLTGKIASVVYLLISLSLLSCVLSAILGWLSGKRATRKVLEKAGLL